MANPLRDQTSDSQKSFKVPYSQQLPSGTENADWLADITQQEASLYFDFDAASDPDESSSGSVRSTPSLNTPDSASPELPGLSPLSICNDFAFDFNSVDFADSLSDIDDIEPFVLPDGTTTHAYPVPASAPIASQLFAVAEAPLIPAHVGLPERRARGLPRPTLVLLPPASPPAAPCLPASRPGARRPAATRTIQTPSPVFDNAQALDDDNVEEGEEEEEDDDDDDEYVPGSKRKRNSTSRAASNKSRKSAARPSQSPFSSGGSCPPSSSASSSSASSSGTSSSLPSRSSANSSRASGSSRRAPARRTPAGRRRRPKRAPTPEEKDFACGIGDCKFVQRDGRTPDLVRHRLKHTRGERPPEHVCRGARVAWLRAHGVDEPEALGEVFVDEQGVEWVGGCWRDFSRADALLRHWRHKTSPCVSERYWH